MLNSLRSYCVRFLDKLKYEYILGSNYLIIKFIISFNLLYKSENLRKTTTFYACIINILDFFLYQCKSNRYQGDMKWRCVLARGAEDKILNCIFLAVSGGADWGGEGGRVKEWLNRDGGVERGCGGLSLPPSSPQPITSIKWLFCHQFIPLNYKIRLRILFYFRK